MADVKQEGGKWVVVSDDGKKKEKHDTKEQAVKRLKEWEGHKYRSEGKKPVKKKKSELQEKLISLADQLDKANFIKEADEIDVLIKKLNG